jgi:hypothetical protein
MSRSAAYVTVPAAARRLGGAEVWAVRRVADTFPEVIRVGQYRAIPVALLGRIEAELKRRGWLREAAEVGTAG